MFYYRLPLCSSMFRCAPLHSARPVRRPLESSWRTGTALSHGICHQLSVGNLMSPKFLLTLIYFFNCKIQLVPLCLSFLFFFFFPGHNFWAFTGTVLCPSLSFLSLTVGRTVCFNFIASGHLSCLLEPVPGIQGPLLLPLFASLWMTSFLLPAWSYSLKLTLSQASQPSEEFCSSLLH